MRSSSIVARAGLLLSTVGLLACGGTAATTDAGRVAADSGGGASALIGTWGVTGCVDSDFTSCDSAYTFGADGSYSGAATFVKDPAATTGFAGCTITLDVTGYRYSASATTLSVVASSPQQLTTRAGCANPSDDQATPVPSPEFTPSSYLITDAAYSISGDTLTIAGGALTRR